VAEEFDLAVVGGGPGGYTAAIRAAQLGWRTVLIEKDRLGGVCGNWGCIPSKSLIHSASVFAAARSGEELGIVPGSLGFDYSRMVGHSRGAADRVGRGVAQLLRKNGVTVIEGEGRLDEGGRLRVNGGTPLDSPLVLLAAGSVERVLPGLEPSPPQVTTSREFLEQTTLPESLVIVGGGVIGIELGYVASSLDVRVTIVELQEQLLPGIDASIARELERILRRRGVVVRTGTRYLDLARERDGVRLRVEKNGEEDEIAAQRCLVAVGRRAHTEGLGLDVAGIAVDGGSITIDERFRTSRPDILAIGDLVDSPQLAHVAAAEGIAAVEIAAGRRPPGRLDPRTIPACVYCRPEIATVGLNEQQARRAGFDIRVGEFSYRALGRAIATGETEGMVKIIVEGRSGEVLGAHVLGEAATDVIAEAAMVMGLEGTVWDFGATVHAHPTFAEGLLEAALASLGQGINA
jgi:dihydrolipoamide dehydrogenase